MLSVLLLGPFSLGTATPASAQDEPSSAAAAEHYDQGRVAEAVAIYRTLAREGHVGAQVSLAGLYAGGEVTGERNYARAAQWYRAAARQGDAVAQLNLGDFYARGLGVERDFVEAWVWLSLAAEQGRNWAERRREEIASRLNEQGRERAERLLAERRP